MGQAWCSCIHDADKVKALQDTVHMQDAEIRRLNMRGMNDSELNRFYECKICMSNHISVVFLPCGHTLACSECAAKTRKCPVCMTTIQDVTEIYFP